MRSTLPLHLVGLLGGLGLGVSCTEFLSGHCANLEGDQTCAERAMGSFCNACNTDADGCSDVMPVGGCYFPGLGEGGSSNPNTTDDGGITAGDETAPDPNPDSGMTTEPGEACASDGECADPTPFCVNGVCGECIAAVPGACGGTTPVCDDDSNTCVACSEHVQCGDAACNFFTGECLPADAVVHVGPGFQFETLSAAAASFGPLAKGTIVVHELNTENYDTLAVGDGRVLAFLASNKEGQPSWDNGVGNRARHLEITNGTVLIDGLTLFRYYNPTAAAAILVSGNGSRAWIDGSRIIDNVGGIRAEAEAEVVLRNCFVSGWTESPALGSNRIVVELNNASATILYSTITTNTNDLLSVPALGCTSPVAVEVRNSIIVSQGGEASTELSCEGPSVSVVHSATEVGGEFNSGWFDDFNAGDLHLTALGDTAFANIAEWRAGDPPVDIDGNPRPVMDGTSDYPGADHP